MFDPDQPKNSISEDVVINIVSTDTYSSLDRKNVNYIIGQA